MVLKLNNIVYSKQATNMSCHSCRFFLHDFLLTGVPEGIALQKDIKMKILPRVSWSLAGWIQQVAHRIEHIQFQKAANSSSMIAKRGRKDVEYEYILFTATFNFLKYEVPWLQQEEELLTVLLMESGLFKGKNVFRLMTVIKDYIRYTTIRCMYLLKELHEDHLKPKGLQTMLDHILPKKQMVAQKEDTLYDRDDDYQKEILDEVDLSEFGDLYT